MRLDRLISMCGYTRTEAKELIRKGRVSVAGQVLRDAGAGVPDDAALTIDGREASPALEVFLMMNKPAGILTATEDPRSKTVCDLLPEALRRRRIGPVGRLDKDVTGLVILTTDGQTAHRLISPKMNVPKVYIAETEGTPDEKDIELLARGVEFQDFSCRPAQLEVLRPELVRITVTEGKYHEVKRLLHHVGHDVKALKRVSLAGLSLDPALNEGEWRYLTEEETALLRSY